MRIFQTIPSLVLVTGLCLPMQAREHDPDPPPPNILFLLADDQRHDVLGSAGHPFIETPVIDRLAGEGVRFENAFVTTSICAASRASILTGLHERTHDFTFRKPPIPEPFTKASYPALLRDAGYYTGFIGKFGVQVEGEAISRMFDSFREIGRNPYIKELEDGTRRHETDLAGDEAVQFLKERPNGKPFCLSISFNAPHAEDSDHRPGIGHYPWPESVDGLYEDLVMPAPQLADPAIFEAHPDFLKNSINRIRHSWRWDTPGKYQTNMRAYLRMISGIDRVVGRLRDTLQSMGLDENTIIIYMADNGYYMGERGFAGKWSHYEESLRVPLIVYDPRVGKSLRGRVAGEMVLNIDVPATILDLAGVEIPGHYQGTSLSPVLSGSKPFTWRNYFFCEHLMEDDTIPKWEGIRGERFAYARYFEQDPVYEFLHDLRNDPNQLENLAGSAGFQRVLEEMRRLCISTRDRLLEDRKEILDP